MLADYYRWLQYQQPLLLSEKIWTYPCETKRQAIKLLEHTFWRSIYHGSQSRKRPFLGCYYIMLLEVTDFGENINERRLCEFASGLDDNSVNSVLIETICRQLDIVNHVFHGSSLKDLKEVIPVYQAVHILKKAGPDLEQPDRGCLTDWYKKVQEKAVSYHQKYGVVDTLFKMTHVKYRDLFWGEQEQNIIEIVRTFSKARAQKEQKQSNPRDINPQTVVDRQRGLCPLCDRRIENVLGGDYVLQFKKDNPITLENCTVVHRECHLQLTQRIPNLELAAVEITSEIESQE